MEEYRITFLRYLGGLKEKSIHYQILTSFVAGFIVSIPCTKIIKSIFFMLGIICLISAFSHKMAVNINLTAHVIPDSFFDWRVWRKCISENKTLCFGFFSGFFIGFSYN